MESVQVKEYMNQYPVTFTPEMSVEEASLRFLKTKQIGGPVIDRNYRLVGFLSESDVLEKMLKSIYHNAHIANVGDIMRTDVLAVKTYDSIVELGQGMVANKPKVYPVVDDDGNLKGTISRNDVLRAIDLHMRESFKVGA
ncbi:CBS domain-containing protein [Thalassotalea sp. LPB0316]|uniref:CBS domain-containing protein n=1 Tax=Thalassotalea sp. LPB0316 TaxID=2769490 RepID=UPI0018660162|nr:CBS domain-containing protein [Thalassotalea sp. LPB0316]QOL24942.1 CBS domain-containing protein [Thalassotalea sp. LPB0316]